MKKLLVSLRVCLGGFLIFMGGVKLISLSQFVEAVANYQMLERPYDAYLAYVLPWVEVLSGLAILSGIFLRGGLLVTILMMVGFTSAIMAVWNQGLNINCGCFGVSDEPTNYPLAVARNIGIFALSLWLFWTTGRTVSKLPA